MIRMAVILCLLALLAGGAAAWAAGLRPAYLFDPAPQGHRIAEGSGGPAAPLPEGRPLKLAILGTSLTARYAWPEGLRTGLEACLGRPSILSRTAKAGAGSDWGVEAVQDVAAAQPDLALIEFSINDADLSDGVLSGGIISGGAWLGAAERRHRAMIEALRAANPDMRIALVTMSPAHGPRGWVRPFLGAHEDMYRRLADEMNLALIDLAPLWAKALAGGGDLLPDGLHPTEAAATEIALPTMISQVGKMVGATC